MSGLLTQMATTSRDRLRAAQAREGLDDLVARARSTPTPPPLRLGTFDLIAEIKLVAPSAGRLAEAPTDRHGFVADRARAYAAGGAAAISVLTEPLRFDGRPEDLLAAAAAVDVPVMRKDFLVDPYQVWEARAWGAGGVLVIVRMLDDAALRAMVQAAADAGLFVLLEAFDALDLSRSSTVLDVAPTTLVGVNTRDLVSLEVDGGRLASLAPHVPVGAPRVAESGMQNEVDVRRAARLGYDLALVGSAFMGSADPAATVASFLAAGRPA